jgi:hypothetical protein
MDRPILLAATLAALAASAAFAQGPAPPPPPGGVTRVDSPGEDPNQIICRSEGEVGSRLNRHRTCATRQQWAERMRQDRQYLEKAQTNRSWCKNGPC